MFACTVDVVKFNSSARHNRNVTSEVELTSLSFMNHVSSGGVSYSADLQVKLTRSLIRYLCWPPSITGLSGLVSVVIIPRKHVMVQTK